MKFFKIAVFIFIFPILFAYGCKEKSFNYSLLERDNFETGGNLTFVYDDYTHAAVFGGEGEVVQYYKEDISKGWKESGCRVGIKILLPKGVDEFKSGSAKLNNKKISTEDFFVQSLDGQINYAVFYPIVSEEEREIQLKIIWKEGYAEQTYLILIKEGTLFMHS